MLTENISLKKMLDFKPSDMDMAMLPLDIVVYIKVSVVSTERNDNYDFIRYLFINEEISDYFKQIKDTVFYDFDGRNTDGKKFITIFELYSLYNFDNISSFLKEIMESYTHEADVLIDLYTHDSREYRLSNLDGIVKLEEITKNNAA